MSTVVQYVGLAVALATGGEATLPDPTDIWRFPCRTCVEDVVTFAERHVTSCEMAYLRAIGTAEHQGSWERLEAARAALRPWRLLLACHDACPGLTWEASPPRRNNWPLRMALLELRQELDGRNQLWRYVAGSLEPSVPLEHFRRLP